MLQIYVDGACSNNQNQVFAKARSGAYFPSLKKGVSRDLSGEVHTNNRAELDAIILALEQLQEMGKAELDVTIFSDSKYAMNIATKLWKNKNNHDLVEKLWKQMAAHKGQIKFEYVRGHSKDENNDMADKLATGKIAPF